jgi:Cu+-exporting ATPase
MDTLVALGTSAAYSYSLYAIVTNILAGAMLSAQFFETTIFLIFFILLGKYLESFAKGETSSAIRKLHELTPDSALLVTFDKVTQTILNEREINLELLQVGDIVRVKPGARIPSDGIVVHGQSFVDESMLTGEATPILKEVESNVIGGTVNQNGPLLVQILKTGQDTTLARIINLVQDAQASKAPIQEYADKISAVFVPVVILLSILTFCTWIVCSWLNFIPVDMVPAGKTFFTLAIEHAVAVLVIACPCALGLATPTAVMVGSGVAAKLGILVKGGGAALEASSKIKTIVFDKTGTLTVCYTKK